MDLFDKLVDLLGDEELPLREYAQILDAGFAEARVGVIPPGVDEVMAGDMERTRLKDVKVLFFLGVNEGSVPKSSSRAGILSDMEREELRKAGLELAPGAREQAYIQRFYLYLNLTKPSERLYVSYSLLDGAGRSLRPSYFVSVLKKALSGAYRRIRGREGERGASADGERGNEPSYREAWEIQGRRRRRAFLRSCTAGMPDRKSTGRSWGSFLTRHFRYTGIQALEKPWRTPFTGRFWKTA